MKLKVLSDKLWQEQKSVLKENLDDEAYKNYIEIVELVATKAEQLKSDSVSSIDAIRKSFKDIFQEKGFLIPEALSGMLVILIIHWEYGEELREQLSPIEFSLVAEAMSLQLEQNARRAEETSD